MKVRRVNREEVQEGEIVQSYWDIKKIGIGFVVLAAVVIIGSYFFKFLDNGSGREATQVLGAAENEAQVPPLPDKEDIEGIISDAQDVLSQITSENLTSSQAAIQKVISDLESLQRTRGAVGVICSLMCKDR